MSNDFVGKSVVTLEIVPPTFRYSAVDAFRPRACFSQPHLLRYRVVEVTSFPDAGILIRPFEHPLRAFWRRSKAVKFIQAKGQQ